MVNILMIRKRDMVYIYGLMEELILESGYKVNKLMKESMYYQMTQ